jgi:hypothetical protein
VLKKRHPLYKKEQEIFRLQSQAVLEREQLPKNNLERENWFLSLVI